MVPGDPTHPGAWPPAARGPRGLGAPGDLVVDRVAVLATRVLVGHDDDARALAGDAPHERAFGRVPLPGRPEDDEHTATAGRRDRGEQVEHRLERRRAVGIVDDDAKWLARLDP